MRQRPVRLTRMRIFYMLIRRIKGRYQRTAALVLARRPFRMRNQQPLISFTFDDFPRSALFNGGAALERYGAVGTYYSALGLMGKNAPTGEMFRREDLQHLLQRGHELGCHTFGHCHSYDTPAHDFEHSIIYNRRGLKRSRLGRISRLCLIRSVVRAQALSDEVPNIFPPVVRVARPTTRARSTLTTFAPSFSSRAATTQV